MWVFQPSVAHVQWEFCVDHKCLDVKSLTESLMFDSEVEFLGHYWLAAGTIGDWSLFIHFVTGNFISFFFDFCSLTTSCNFTRGLHLFHSVKLPNFGADSCLRLEFSEVCIFLILVWVTAIQRPVVTVEVSDSLQLTSACNIVWQCVTMCYDITHVRTECVFVTSHCWFGPPCPAVTLLWFSRSDVNQNRQYILCSPNSEYCIHICPEYCEYTGTCVSRKAVHTDIFNKHQISGWLALVRH